MKILFLSSLFFLQLQITAQSPYLSVQLKMDSAETKFHRYKIEMKFCEPLKMTERGNWFSKDTSAIDFMSLKPAEISCDKYFESRMPEMITGEKKEKKINQFGFGNQVFAWEKILVFKIADWSSRGWHPEMYIVLPVKYKSFRTSIHITDVVFQSGKVIFLDEPDAKQDGPVLTISSSLKEVKETDVKDFLQKEML